MSALFQHTTNIYKYMEENSELNSLGERLYVGSIQEAVRSAGASSRYYTAIRKLLGSPPDDPCIDIVQRGNTYQPSIVLLKHPPPEGWEKIPPSALTQPAVSATLIAELTEKVEQLQAWRESLGGMNIAEAMINFENRLRRLEGERE